MKKLVAAFVIATLAAAWCIAGQGSRATADTASAPCVFEVWGGSHSCQGTDPHVTINDRSSGDTSGCTFRSHVDWGDGQHDDSPVFAGGPDQSIVQASKHAYVSPGTYTVTLSGEVVSGLWCSFTTQAFTFTLATPVGQIITSPADGNVIAMTDGVFLSPQPKNNERTPAHRNLKVSGKNPCGCAVTVNGVSAATTGATWTAVIPNVTPGKLTLHAQTANGQQDAIEITLIDIVITSPTENQSVPLRPDPAMPDLNAHLQVQGLTDATPVDTVPFTWQLQAHNRYVTRTVGQSQGTWKDDQRTIATGTTTGADVAWHPDYGKTILGGWDKLTVSANIPGVVHTPVVSEPRWFDMPGGNPTESAIRAYILSAYNGLTNKKAIANKTADDPHVIGQLACHESARTFNQFTADKKNFDRLPATVPSDWPLKTRPLRPLYGAPAGIGLMQIDPATFPNIQWNWHDNIDAGVTKFYANKENARTYYERVQANKDLQLVDHTVTKNKKTEHVTGLLTTVNANRAKKHLKPLTPANVKVKFVTQFSHDELERDAIRQYNGGHEYIFPAEYAITSNGLNITVTGQQKWIEGPHTHNPNYVNQVLTCQKKK